MGHRYRTLRAAATALVLAAAIGAGGTAGMTSALAVDPGMVTLGGSLVDGEGLALGGVDLLITEELPPDGGAAAFPVTTAADGSFSAEVYAWGTANAPASLSIATLPDASIELIGESCSQTWGVELLDERSLALAEADPEPLALTASTTLLGEVCGTTGTPPPATTPDDGGTGGAAITPPPTDGLAAAAVAEPDRLGPALTLGFLVGLLMAAALLAPRPGARRRD